MASNYAGNNSKTYPNAFLNNMWNGTVMYWVPSATHIFQVQNIGQSRHRKSTKREIHVLVTPIVHLSTSYDNSHYFCNKLHLWIPTLKNEQSGVDHLIIATMTVISWFEIGCFIPGNSLPIRTFASTCGCQVPLLPWAAQDSATLAATVLHNVFTCSWYIW